MVLQFSGQQQAAISITERVCSSISLAASSIIVATFIGSKSFRKPINRLVFYASFGNILANVGTMVSQSGIHYGPRSSLCQFQAFFIQWFVPADSLWALTMACNVYLALFHHYNTDHLRPLEWKYFVFCYGLPFIPAFVLLFIETKAHGKLYGPAIQWCWISVSYDYLQIAVFYGPVWFIILLTFSIYARVSVFIFQQRRRFNKYVATDSLEIQRYSPRRAGGSSTTDLPGSSSSEHHAQLGEQTSQSSSPGVWNGSSGPVDLPTPSPESMAVWAYSKYAVLFFVALLITWVPSSANRVYALSRHNDYLFGLTYASSFVLPLQGFWNTAIYITVSWHPFKRLPCKISHSNLHDVLKRFTGRFQRAKRSLLHSWVFKKAKRRLGYQ